MNWTMIWPGVAFFYTYFSAIHSATVFDSLWKHTKLYIWRLNGVNHTKKKKIAIEQFVRALMSTHIRGCFYLLSLIVNNNNNHDDDHHHHHHFFSVLTFTFSSIFTSCCTIPLFIYLIYAIPFYAMIRFLIGSFSW